MEDFDSTILKDLENMFVSNTLPFLFLLLSFEDDSDDISTRRSHINFDATIELLKLREINAIARGEGNSFPSNIVDDAEDRLLLNAGR